LKKIVILGGGLAGLSLAWNLLKDGYKPILIEKEKALGGMSATFEDEGYRFDYGPHNVHSVYPDIIDFLKDQLKEDLIKYHPNMKIFFKDKFILYPIKGLAALKVLPIWVAIQAVFSFVIARIGMLFLGSREKERSFKEWITQRFGKVLYNTYFGPYAEKMWSIDASEISEYVAIKRVPIFSISDYITKLILKRNLRQHSEDITLIENFYPQYGAGQIVDFFVNEIKNMGGEIITDCEISKITGSEKHIDSLEIIKNNQPQTVLVDFLYNTIPINELFKKFGFHLPETIKKSVNEIDFCAERLLYLKVNKEKVFPSTLTYFSDPLIKFNRIYDVRSFSSKCVPSGKTGLCIEFTCNENDEVWNMDEKDIYQYTIDVFTKYDLLDENEIEGYFTKRIKHAYPRFRVGFQKRIKEILEFATRIDNFITFGRQGLFTYANMDDVIKMSFTVCPLHSIQKRKHINYPDLFPSVFNF